jgi:hypothetical protein
MILAAKPWFFWLGALLFGVAVLGVVATMVGYYVKVSRNKVARITKR